MLAQEDQPSPKDKFVTKKEFYSAMMIVFLMMSMVFLENISKSSEYSLVGFAILLFSITLDYYRKSRKV